MLIESEYTLGHTISGSWYQLAPGKRESLLAWEILSADVSQALGVRLRVPQALTSCPFFRVLPFSVFANMADLGWAKAAYSTFGNFNQGATLLVQPPPPGNFTPTHLLEMLHRFPVTSLCAPPTIYRTLVSAAAVATLKSKPLNSLEHCVSAGEPLNASVIREWREATGITIKDAWGQSETVSLSVEPRPSARR